MWLVPVLTAAAFFAVGCTAEKIVTSETTSAVTELVIPENSELPARYDAREDGRTAPVKNQGDLGTCWAFASLLALESSLLPEESYDFSEDHMSHDPNFLLDQKSGGDYIMSMAYLLSWRGPVLEEEDPYGDGISPEGLTAAKHVQEIRILPAYDREAVKAAVYRTGGVQSALYTTLQRQEQDSRYYNDKTGAYYYSGTLPPNHDVVIVGWDDDYPAENFSELFFARTAGERDSAKRGFSMFPITIPISVPPICSIPMWNRQTIMTGSIRLICADGWGRSAMEMRMCGEQMFIRLQPACSRSVLSDFMRWMQIRNMRSASSRTCRTSRQQTGGT